MFFQWFLLSFTKSTFSKKLRQKYDLGSIFESQNDENTIKIIFKNVLLSNIDLEWFSYRIWLHFGSQKMFLKLIVFKKKMEVQRRPLKHHFFRIAFWMDFEIPGARF